MINWKFWKKKHTLSPEDIAALDKLAAEFLSIWVESHKVTTMNEMVSCVVRACETYDKIAEIDRRYDLSYDIDYESTDYLRPDMYRAWRCPHAAFHRQTLQLKKRIERQQIRQKNLSKLMRCRKS